MAIVHLHLARHPGGTADWCCTRFLASAATSLQTTGRAPRHHPGPM